MLPWSLATSHTPLFVWDWRGCLELLFLSTVRSSESKDGIWSSGEGNSLLHELRSGELIMLMSDDSAHSLSGSTEFKMALT